MRSHAKAAVAVLAMLFTLAFASSASADAPPAVTIDPASEVGVTGAKLKGTVDPEGGPSATYWRFEVAPTSDPEAWNYVGGGAFEGAEAEGTDPVAVSVDATSLQPETSYRVRIVAENEWSEETGEYGNRAEAIEPATFTTDPATAPVLTIDPATPGYTVAELSGTVDPEGGNSNPATGPVPIYWYLQYSKDPVNEGWSTGAEGVIEGAAAEGSTAVPVEADLAPGTLQHDTEYQYRLFAYYAAFSREASVDGPSFQTLTVAKPTVTLNPVSSITAETASFNGEVNPNAPEGAPTTADVEAAFASEWRFECTPSCPNTPGTQTLAADNQPTPVSFDPKDLEPNTDYVVKLFASNKGGEEMAERSFKTPPLGPTVAAGTVGALTHNSARLTAYVDPNNTPTTATFEYDTDPSFANPTIATSGSGSEVTGNGSKVAYADIAGLAPQGDYYWRVSVQSAEGTDADVARTGFETWSVPGQDKGGIGVEGRRKLELVSTGAKNVSVADEATISADGNRVVWAQDAGTDDVTFGTGRGYVLADRTANGWKTRSALPPNEDVDHHQVNMVGASPGLDTFILQAAGEFAVAGPFQYFLYKPYQSLLVPGPYVTDQIEQTDGSEVFSSENAERVYAFGYKAVYEVMGPDGGFDPVSLMPEGHLPACGLAIGWPNWANLNKESRAASVNGERIFFRSRGDDCGAPPQLYMRQSGSPGSTTLISTPPVAGPPAEAKFVKATPAGDQVFYVTEAKITAEDTNEEEDLYRYTIGEGSECITCFLGQGRVEGINFGYTSMNPGAVASEDGRSVYFGSPAVLALGATANPKGSDFARPATNLYLWRESDPDKVTYVAPATRINAAGSSLPPTVFTTSDGTVTVFKADRPELDALTATFNGGMMQSYRYDHRDNTLVCMTCAPTVAGEIGAPFMTGLNFSIKSFSELSKDGNTYVFQTNTALVEQDNGGTDIYEWHNGQVGLITEPALGLSQAQSWLSAASNSGDDVLLMAYPPPDYPSPDRTRQLFDARVGGGFPLTPSPTPCSGDGCRGSAAPPPPEVEAGTATFSAPPNRRCIGRKVIRQGRCVVKKPRKSKPQRKSKGHKGKGTINNKGGK